MNRTRQRVHRNDPALAVESLSELLPGETPLDEAALAVHTLHEFFADESASVESTAHGDSLEDYFRDRDGAAEPAFLTDDAGWEAAGELGGQSEIQRKAVEFQRFAEEFHEFASQCRHRRTF